MFSQGEFASLLDTVDHSQKTGYIAGVAYSQDQRVSRCQLFSLTHRLVLARLTASYNRQSQSDSNK